jgi:hypothetical protein
MFSSRKLEPSMEHLKLTASFLDNTTVDQIYDLLTGLTSREIFRLSAQSEKSYCESTKGRYSPTMTKHYLI